MRLTQDRASYDEFIDVVNKELSHTELYAAKSPATPTPLQDTNQEFSN